MNIKELFAAAWQNVPARMQRPKRKRGVARSRPAAPFIANKKGLRWEQGEVVSRSGSAA